MKHLIFFSFFLISLSAYSQHEYMTWVELGAEGKLTKKLKLSGELNGRFGSSGVETFFPQLGLEYKVTKWFKPSIEYRFIVDKNKYGNYHSTNRLNINALLGHEYKRLDYSVRIRYQFAFNGASQASYDSDFDQAIRIKPAFKYNIKGSKISPELSAEFFYNPMYGPLSPGFNKVRAAAGIKWKLKGPHEIGIKYQLDKKFRDYSANLRHVASISYGIKF